MTNELSPELSDLLHNLALYEEQREHYGDAATSYAAEGAAQETVGNRETYAVAAMQAKLQAEAAAKLVRATRAAIDEILADTRQKLYVVERVVDGITRRSFAVGDCGVDVARAALDESGQGRVSVMVA
jgi:hypothetical protein